MKETQPNPKSSKRKLIILCTLIAILVVAFLAIDIPARQRFAIVNNEVEKVRTEILNPAGAVERKTDQLPYLRGDGLIGSLLCSPDVHCPAIGREWIMPIEKEKEAAFINSILQLEGYSQVDEATQVSCNNLEAASTCLAAGKKGQLKMSISVNALNTAAPLSKDVSTSKQWRLVGFGVELF